MSDSEDEGVPRRWTLKSGKQIATPGQCYGLTPLRGSDGPIAGRSVPPAPARQRKVQTVAKH